MKEAEALLLPSLNGLVLKLQRSLSGRTSKGFLSTVEANILLG